MSNFTNYSNMNIHFDFRIPPPSLTHLDFYKTSSFAMNSCKNVVEKLKLSLMDFNGNSKPVLINNNPVVCQNIFNLQPTETLENNHGSLNEGIFEKLDNCSKTLMLDTDDNVFSSEDQKTGMKISSNSTGCWETRNRLSETTSNGEYLQKDSEEAKILKNDLIESLPVETIPKITNFLTLSTKDEVGGSLTIQDINLDETLTENTSIKITDHFKMAENAIDLIPRYFLIPEKSIGLKEDSGYTLQRSVDILNEANHDSSENEEGKKDISKFFPSQNGSAPSKIDCLSVKDFSENILQANKILKSPLLDKTSKVDIFNAEILNFVVPKSRIDQNLQIETPISAEQISLIRETSKIETLNAINASTEPNDILKLKIQNYSESTPTQNKILKFETQSSMEITSAANEILKIATLIAAELISAVDEMLKFETQNSAETTSKVSETLKVENQNFGELNSKVNETVKMKTLGLDESEIKNADPIEHEQKSDLIESSKLETQFSLEPISICKFKEEFKYDNIIKANRQSQRTNSLVSDVFPFEFDINSDNACRVTNNPKIEPSSDTKITKVNPLYNCRETGYMAKTNGPNALPQGNLKTRISDPNSGNHLGFTLNEVYNNLKNVKSMQKKRIITLHPEDVDKMNRNQFQTLTSENTVEILSEFCQKFGHSNICPYNSFCKFQNKELCIHCGLYCLSKNEPYEKLKHEKECQMTLHLERQQELRGFTHKPEKNSSVGQVFCQGCNAVVQTKISVFDRLYGILSNCDHVFCLVCAESRRTDLKDVKRKKIILCSVCGKYSPFCVASSQWIEEEKKEFLVSYIDSVKSVKCKYCREGSTFEVMKGTKVCYHGRTISNSKNMFTLKQ